MLLGHPQLLKSIAEHAVSADLPPTVRLVLIKLAMQARLWPAAEALAQVLVREEKKPTEAYLLLCKCLLEQHKHRAVARLCVEALACPALTQPLTFQLELAKAHAALREPESALHALGQAATIAPPGTVDEHKLGCTRLYVLHLLGRQQECIRQAEALLEKLQKTPWKRQVLFVLAHSQAALGMHHAAAERLEAILSDDPGDGEAMAELARGLLLQGIQLDRAESLARQAIELDYVDRHKRNKLNPVPSAVHVNAAYQATLAAIVLRQNRVQEAIGLLADLNGQEPSRDPWVWICIGDTNFHQQKLPQAQAAWAYAEQLLQDRSHLGPDLRHALTARQESIRSPLRQVGSDPSPASLSSPPRP
jgi:tetratricopeptide (TPR) repeat protein